MRSIEVNENKIYELTKESIIPEYLGPKRQQKIKKNEKKESGKITNRLEVIHDLCMPDISTNLSLSPDGKYLFVLGAYSPRVRVYELEQMSMKFERNVDDIPTKIAFIEKDYSKFVVLEGEKTLSFHGQGGIHKKVRCNDVATDLIFSNYNDKLYVPSSEGSLTLIDVDNGRVHQRFHDRDSKAGINCACYNNRTDLFLCGTRAGTVNGYDARSAVKIYNIDVNKAPHPDDLSASYRPEITKMTFKNPLMVGVGTDKGVVHMYDIRNHSRPWSTRDLDYRKPIKSIIFHEDKVIAALGSVFKIWEPRESDEGSIFASYETNKVINDFFHYPNSGLFFAATNDPQLPTYFIPKIGDAPRWCQQLTNVLVNIEVESQSVYDTHTFITLEELDELNLKHLIGTHSLRAYTHGFYISNNTYIRAKNALSQLNAKEDAEPTMEHRSMGTKIQDDEIPDPSMNVPIKALSVQSRFSSFFTKKEYTVDPSNKEFERVILDKKIHENRKQKRMAKKEKAVKSHKLSRMEGLDDSDVDVESDSESD